MGESPSTRTLRKRELTVLNTATHVSAPSGTVAEDRTLVERAQRGERHAFDRLVLRHQSRLLSVIVRYVGDSWEAADVVQEVFLKAYRSLSGFRGDSQFYTWLYRIAVNVTKNHLAVRGRHPEGSRQSEEREALDYATPEDNVSKDQLESLVMQALRDMPGDMRTAIVLRELEGLSYVDIARTTKAPLGTVRSRIHRARAFIWTRLAPWLS
ncbi:MAG: sigma-70 family RNA polymerase sigma factor [Gammaproteobacteria bacterium]|nr:sigma-70 family RNA polymerase sigma factor [Gammaproteobacteria bacterium]NIR82785.1 sigma-70 family RNA polymerase sigma factor [Gammaproteobacteria bacterium]NIR89649.1 sigma-70 family RNA polymerase sigma factor [Gammaproteobacteria bacterium]NIU03945.1 sigma-70 family RNA polymerase sigma factor [Gammaproteobacteria bacterium]NIV51261.1 sigma-70 family RNA polymerase sigma factor [Gammaproteobacteria bacterium]